MTSAVSEYSDQLHKCIKSRDGEELRSLLSMKSSLASDAARDYLVNGGSLPEPLKAPWDNLPEMIEKRFAAGAALMAQQDWVDSYEHLSQSVSKYLQMISSLDAWCIPALYQLCADLRIIAEQADEQLRANGQKPSKLEEAERVLKRAFMTTNNDRRSLEENSRKIGVLGIIVQLLKIYFKLNNLRLCGNLTRTVNAPNFPSFEKYPKDQRCSYKYFSGRLHLYEDRNKEAIEDLSYALENLPNFSEKNKRQILLYLIPAKILSGSLPSNDMLEYYDMQWFKGIAAAIRTGNLRLFDEAMETHEEFFIRKALYLAIEKMRPLVYRSLCKRICSILGSTKIPLDKICIGLSACDVEMERDEVECILANLIYNNYIKGYISHKVGYIVFSKKNPFPLPNM